MARWLVALAVVAAGLLPAEGAKADDATDAKAHYQKATAHFAVGEYREAAAEYEQAFKLKQDPAILFNAAQAHRLAGDSPKALLLYNNVIKLYPSSPYAADSKDRIAKLSQAGAGPTPAATTGTTTTAPPTAGTASTSPTPAATVGRTPVSPETAVPATAPIAPPASAPQAPPTTGAEMALTAAPPPQNDDRPVYKRWWFWTAVGGVVALGVVAAVVLASGSNPWNNVADVRASEVRW